MKKIGLFFGSFDPIHIGHLNVVASVLNVHLVDEVHLILAYSNPWKPKQTNFEHRWSMAMQAVKSERNIHVSRVEKQVFEKYGITCTYKVLEVIKDMYKDMAELVIITTQETFKEIPNWKNGRDILDNNKFIIVTSDHFGELGFKPRECDEIIDVNDIRVNSTMVRNMIQANQITLPFLTPNVISYIKANNLYKENIYNTNEEEELSV